jgi:hypothetical protein
MSTTTATLAPNEFSICIPRTPAVQWQWVKQVFVGPDGKFPNDQVTRVDVRPYKDGTGDCKIFVHMLVTSPEAIKARDYMLAGNDCFPWGPEGWMCRASRVPKTERPIKTLDPVAEVEYAEPYAENGVPPPPSATPPSSPPPSPPSTAPCGPRPPPLIIDAI